MVFQFSLKPKINLYILILLLILASFNFLLFGLNHYDVPSGDAGHFNAYARNVALGNGYTIDPDSDSFMIYREPGYSFFLSATYLLFGVENFAAVKIIQVALLAITAFFVFKSFELFNARRAGLTAALLFALMPLYAYQANITQSELFTVFLITSSFFLALKILKNGENLKNYILLGFVFGFLILTKAHMALLPLMFAAVFYIKNKRLKHIAVFLFIAAIMVSSWMTYVYSRTGMFTVTKGRQDLHLYTRSIRATLPYDQQIDYFVSWIKWSYLGGTYDEMLEKYEPGPLIARYGQLIRQGYTAEELRRESVERIRQNFGQYLFGNPIELIKMMYVEHLFPPVSPLLTRWVRAVIYLTIYSIFIAGVFAFLFSKTKKLKMPLCVGGLYILYHWFILSFFDVVPRFNTPYLGLYLLVGIAGLANLKDKYGK